MEQLVTTSTNGPQYMASETEIENSRLGELLSKFMADEEKMSNQAKPNQNLTDQIEQMTKAIRNLPLNTWPYDMDDEIDGEPEPNLRLDEPQDIKSVETIGDNEIEVDEDLNGSPPKIKESVRFAKSCPLGSHVVGNVLYDMKASATMKPWWEEKEKIDEEPIVCDKLPCPKVITYTMEKTPSCGTFLIEIIPNQSMLGDFNAMAITNGNLPKAILFPMDGGFLNYRRGIG